MKGSILIISISNRCKEAIEAQKILTEYGNIIHTRLGIHESNIPDNQGIIVLYIIDTQKAKELQSKISNITGIKTYINMIE